MTPEPHPTDPSAPGARPRRGGGFGALLVLVLALLPLVGCGGDGGAGGPGAEGPLVLGYNSDLQTLNPVLSTDQNANDVMYGLLFTPLVGYDSTFRVEPRLAASWEVTDTTVTFELRDDLRWHDGEPVTAEDVAFTYELATDPEVASPLAAAHLSDVLGVEVLGSHRVRFTIRPHASPLEDFYWPPVPEHVLGSVEPSGLIHHDFGRRPVGSGPYRLEAWEAGRALRFAAVDAFPEELGGVPEIERVVYRVLPEATTRVRELTGGAIHVDGPLGPADADRVEASERARVASFPWRHFLYVGWNTRHPLFEDPAVRRALTLALDRDGLLEAGLYGRGQVASGPIPPWHRLSPDLEPLPHAPDSARRLLERAGWTDSDGDGVLDRDGTPFAFQLLSTQENPVLADLAQMIQAQLAELGIEVELRLLEFQTVLGRHRARDFEAVLADWVLDSFRVDPRPLFHGDQVDVEGSANRSSYANPVADSLMDAGVRTSDPEEARRIWSEFARVLQEDQPVTFLFWKDEIAGVSRRLADVRMDARGELATLPSWRWTDEPDEERKGTP